MAKVRTFRQLLPVLATAAVLAASGASRAQLLAPIEGRLATLDREVVPTAGRHEVMLTVARFGRYAILARSETGVTLQLVNRMAGPGEVTGVAGQEDGRLDVFLDYGEYKLIVIGHDKATDEARLAVHPFAELAPSPAEQLVELKPVTATLGDFEQRSYWLEVTTRRWVHLEAGGRALRDLRLWQDGSWLLEGAPTVEVLDPVVGQPLAACRLSLQLEPGLYLATAYGGRPEPWAEESGKYPFYLRFGIPSLPTAGRARHEISPLGIDRWLIPARANFFRLELLEPLPVSIRVRHFDDAGAFAGWGEIATIDKDSREPAAELANDINDNGFDLVTVSAEAGQAYVLEHFEKSWHYGFDGSGPHWISTIHTGHAEDSVDATAFLARWHGGRLDREPLREQTIVVGGQSGWATRCNLLDTMSVFLDVRDTGTYAIESRGTEARFRIEPFFVYRPDGYQPPPFKLGNSEWELDKGYYVLTAEPERKGILELAIRPKGLVQDLLATVGDGVKVDEEAVRGSVRFPEVQLSRDDYYRLYLNQQPGVSAGMILRPLPLDLRDAVPLSIRPGVAVEMPIKVAEESTLRATAEDGSALEVAVDGGGWQRAERLMPGNHDIKVRNRGEATVPCSVGAIPTRLEQTTPLPQLPQAAIDALPEFPVVTATAPQLFDLARGQRTTFLLSAATDGLYRLETTGLLDTTGTVRSRTVTALATSGSGGTGRNFFLHQYLLSGDYQVSVKTNGQSAGHLGLALTRTDPRDGGSLRLGLPARTELDPGGAIVYRFHIDKTGDYRLRSFALGRTVRCRLEDADGWPIVTPNVAADIERRLEPGDCRLVLLPEPVWGRRLTLLERIVKARTFEGHGPHAVAVGEKVTHRWLEPEEGAIREPDVWTFELGGATEVELRLNAEMEGRLIAIEHPDRVVTVPPRRGWKGGLEAGGYRLEVVCARPNNRVDYELGITPTALVAGAERELAVPAEVPVAVAGDDLVEISSFGVVDVRARLEDASGRVLAASDDRPGDWNFNLGGRLEPGAYTLVVQPVDGRPTRTRVRMIARRQIAHEVSSVPFDQRLEPGDDEHVLVLPGSLTGVLVASLEADETVGLAVEQRRGEERWTPVASETGGQPVVVVPVSDATYRLRAWSVDRRGGAAHLRAFSFAPPVVREAELARVTRLEAIPGFAPPLAVAEVALDQPGTLQHSGAGLGLRWSPDTGQALQPVRKGLLSTRSRHGFLAVEAPAGRVAVKASRVRLDDTPLQLTATPGDTVVVDVVGARAGPLAVVAESMLGQAALRLGGAGEAGSLSLTSSALSKGAAVAVAPAGKDVVASLWLADAGVSRADLRLRRVACTSQPPRHIGYGRYDGSVERGLALPLELPDGVKELRLTLSGGIAAATLDRGIPDRVYVDGSETLVTVSTELMILGLDDGRWALEVAPCELMPAPLATGAPFAQKMAQAGRIRLEVTPEAGDQRWLAVAGAIDDALFIGDDGRTQRGDRIAIGAGGGVLQLELAPGLAMAWIASTKEVEAGLWHATDLPPRLAIAVPSRPRLPGPEAALRFACDEESLLHLAVSTPAVLRVASARGQHHWLVTGSGLRHLLVPAGAVEIAIRTLTGDRLGDSLSIALSPVRTVGSGLGPVELLGPGDGRAYRFTVTDPGPIGVGVRAEPDTVSCELLDASGEVLGEGVVQMHELEAGEYLLVVRSPADGGAVSVQPAVVGLERPSTGPPEEVIRGYVESEGGAP